MSCIKAEKKKIFFGLFTVNGHHEDDIEIGVHMKWISTDYIVERRCKLCGRFKRTHFVSHETLLSWGYTVEELKEAQRTQIF